MKSLEESRRQLKIERLLDKYNHLKDAYEQLKNDDSIPY